MGMEARTAQWAQCAIKCKSPQRFIMRLTAQGVACSGAKGAPPVFFVGATPSRPEHHCLFMRLTAQGVACCAPTKKHHSVEKG